MRSVVAGIIGAVFEVELPEVGGEVEPAHGFAVLHTRMQVEVRERRQRVAKKRATGAGRDYVFSAEGDMELFEQRQVLDA